MNFIQMRDKMLTHFASMTENNGRLFEVEVDKDKLWNMYLDSFPSDKNPIYREHTEHDCSCCRHFIKTLGNVVAIRDGDVISLWDFDVDGDDTYEPSVKAMREYIHSCRIADVYLAKERRIGTPTNKELFEGNIKNFDHFYADIPTRYVWGGSKSEKQAELRDTRNVFKRSLDEISSEAVNIVLELIAQNSLYRGEEHKGVLEKFAGYKTIYDTLNDSQKEIYAWEKSAEAGMAVGRIRNHSIGTLLTDITNGVELVRLFAATRRWLLPQTINVQRQFSHKGCLMKQSKQSLILVTWIVSAEDTQRSTISQLTTFCFQTVMQQNVLLVQMYLTKCQQACLLTQRNLTRLRRLALKPLYQMFFLQCKNSNCFSRAE